MRYRIALPTVANSIGQYMNLTTVRRQDGKRWSLTGNMPVHPTVKSTGWLVELLKNCHQRTYYPNVCDDVTTFLNNLQATNRYYFK